MTSEKSNCKNNNERDSAVCRIRAKKCIGFHRSIPFASLPPSALSLGNPVAPSSAEIAREYQNCRLMIATRFVLLSKLIGNVPG